MRDECRPTYVHVDVHVDDSQKFEDACISSGHRWRSRDDYSIYSNKPAYPIITYTFDGGRSVQIGYKNDGFDFLPRGIRFTGYHDAGEDHGPGCFASNGARLAHTETNHNYEPFVVLLPRGSFSRREYSIVMTYHAMKAEVTQYWKGKN